MKFRFTGADVDTSKFNKLEIFDWWMVKLTEEITRINEDMDADDDAIRNQDPRRPEWRKRAKTSLQYLRDVRGKLEFERNAWANQNTVNFRKIKTYFHLVASERLPANVYEALMREAEERARKAAAPEVVKGGQNE
jgi:hypothetical protein